MKLKNKEVFYARASNRELTIKGSNGGALTAVLKFLLDEGIVESVLAVKKGKDIYDPVPALINDSKEILKTAGSLHCGTFNLAKLVEKYLNGAKNLNLAVTCKTCEIRTLIELAKKERVNLENIIIIGINCGGTIPATSLREFMYNKGLNPDDMYKEEVFQGKIILEKSDGNVEEISLDHMEAQGEGRRENCQRCEINIPEYSDLSFGNWGVMKPYSGKYSFLEVSSDKGKEILNKAMKQGILIIKEPPLKSLKLREKIDKKMMNMALDVQKNSFKHEKSLISIFYRYEEEWGNCIRCLGCRESCPLCFCEECTLDSKNLQWLLQGDIPPSPLFHLERLIHIIESCTNCGQCEDACPMDIPLSKISQEMTFHLKNIFNYYPGIINEKLPLSYFR